VDNWHRFYMGQMFFLSWNMSVKELKLEKSKHSWRLSRVHEAHLPPVDG